MSISIRVDLFKWGYIGEWFYNGILRNYIGKFTRFDSLLSLDNHCKNPEDSCSSETTTLSEATVVWCQEVLLLLLIRIYIPSWDGSK